MGQKIAVIGGGISGISAAKLLSKDNEVILFEKHATLGGLLRCKEYPQGLYHLLGGHVFNTKVPAVSKWFWQHFDQNSEFLTKQRQADIWLERNIVGYPIENFLYQLPAEIGSQVISELLALHNSPAKTYDNFHDFLLNTFGKTLCKTYFFPYNQKIWQTSLKEIPVGWLEGKLPTPNIQEIISSNILRQGEQKMVHANFFYPKHGGSQFTVNRLAEGLNIQYNAPVSHIQRQGNQWKLNASPESFDAIVYTGDVRELSKTCKTAASFSNIDQLNSLKTRGISNVFCECDPTQRTWRYIPDKEFAANRIIYTGALSPHNNAQTDRMTCVVEFVYGESVDNIERDLKTLPGNLTEIARNDVRDAYVIQQPNTHQVISQLQDYLNEQDFYLCGRFAQWEYFNTDKAIESAMATAQKVGAKQPIYA